jgi:hypothetical protein
MYRTFYKKGSWNRICDRTGFKVKAEDTVKEWQGLIVRKQSAELRNQQEFIRGIPDKQNAPEPRPDSDPVYLTTNEVTAASLNSRNT